MEITTPSTLAGRDFPLGVTGFTYQDLHREDRLADLDLAFLAELAAEEPALHGRLLSYRADPKGVGPLELSRLLVEAARPLSRFLVRLFGVEAEWRAQAACAGPEAVLFRFRRDFLQRRAVKTKLPEDLASMDTGPAEAEARSIETLFPELPWGEDAEISTSRMVVRLLDLESEFQAVLRQKKRPEVDAAAREQAHTLSVRAGEATDSDDALLGFLERTLGRYAAWCHLRLRHPKLRAAVAAWVSFHLPEVMDYRALVETERRNPSFPRSGSGRRAAGGAAWDSG